MAKRGFLALPIMPLQKLFKPKNAAISFEMIFYHSYCYINEHLAEGEDRDKWLIISFVSYVAKFFYICDNRQREPMMGAYSSLFQLKKVDYTDFIGFVERQVYDTLNPQEQKAKNGLFTQWSPPPYLLVEEEQTDSKRIAKYEFLVAEGKSGGVVPHLTLSFGLDIMILPHSVALFHKYVMKHLSTAKHKALVNWLSLEVLNNITDTNPSALWEKNTVERILNDAHLI